MPKETSIELKSLLRFDLIVILLMLFIPLIFFGERALTIILVAFLIAVSRASSFYDNLKVEIHSILILVMSNAYGPLPGIFAAIITAPLVIPFGKVLGGIQRPPWIVLDTVYLCILAYISSILSPNNLFFYGMLVIILFGNGLVGFIRVYVMHDPLSRRVPLSVLNIMFSYLILKNFLPKILALFK